MSVKEIRTQVESINYSGTKLVDLGNQQVNVSRLVYIYEIGTMNRVSENEYELEAVIKKLVEMSMQNLETTAKEADEDDYGDDYDDYIRHMYHV